MNKCQIIAEVSCTHLGDMRLAEEMIVAAKKNGASYIKFQTWHTKNLKSGPWDFDGRRSIYEQAQLSHDQHILLKQICCDNDIKFLTSIYSMSDIDFLSTLCNEIKIPGPECKNKELVEACLEKFDRVFISTGSTNYDEFKDYFKNKKAILMHCVSIYPCPVEKVNIGRVKTIAKLAHTGYGYSGHMEGIFDAIAAISFGCDYVEKHFTISTDIPHRDAKFAILPQELLQLSQYAEAFYLMNKDYSLNSLPEEKEVRDIYSGRWTS